MSKADFNQGVEVGIKLVKEALIKEQEGLNYIHTELDGILKAHSDLKDSVNNLIDDFTKENLEKYYGLINELNPKDIPDEIKGVLMNIISTLRSSMDINNYQRAYVANLRDCIKLSNYEPDNCYDYSMIKKVRNLDHQYIILKCIIEFLFLSCMNTSFEEEYDYIFENFNLSQEETQTIFDKTELTYRLFQEAGIVQMYGNHIAIKDLPLDTDNKPLVDGIKLEKMEINDELTIEENDELIIENKFVYIKNEIICNGKLVFINCMVVYKCSHISNGIVSVKGHLEFTNCVIKMLDKYTDATYRSTLIECSGSCKISECYFEGAAFFISFRDAKKIDINESEFYSCYAVLEGSGQDGSTRINGCYFDVKDDEMYNNNFPFNYDLIVLKHAIITNCCFEGTATSKYVGDRFSSSLVKGATSINNCSFYNTRMRVQSPHLSACRFENCSNIYCPRGSLDKIIDNDCIEECIFIKCTNITKTMPWNHSLQIDKCQFLECYGNLIWFSGTCEIEDCAFINTLVPKADEMTNAKIHDCNSSIWFDQGSRVHSYSAVKKCLFDGAIIDDGYLIASNSIGKVTPYIAKVEHCAFNHINSSNRDIIKTNTSYFGAFNKLHTVEGIRQIDNLMDNINTSSGKIENYEIKEQSVSGELIGADLKIRDGISGNITKCVYLDGLNHALE